jgi:hypothetical protein
LGWAWQGGTTSVVWHGVVCCAHMRHYADKPPVLRIEAWKAYDPQGYISQMWGWSTAAWLVCGVDWVVGGCHQWCVDSVSTSRGCQGTSSKHWRQESSDVASGVNVIQSVDNMSFAGNDKLCKVTQLPVCCINSSHPRNPWVCGGGQGNDVSAHTHLILTTRVASTAVCHLAVCCLLLSAAACSCPPDA